jgi:hypothetical protein
MIVEKGTVDKNSVENHGKLGAFLTLKSLNLVDPEDV